MKSMTWLCITLLTATAVHANPGAPQGGPGDQPGGGAGQPQPLGWAPPAHRHPTPIYPPPIYPGPRPGIVVDILPPGYRTVLFAGLTYFVVNEIWYQLHGDRYRVVTPPAASQVQENNPYYENGMTRVDIDGIRYYVRDGRYYRRNANGEYLEVTPPTP